MHITRDAASNLPSQNESKRRRSDTSSAAVFVRTSSNPLLPPPAAPPIDDVVKASSVTSVSQFRSLRCRVDAYVAHEPLRHALPKLSFEICIAINRFLASASAPVMFHRVTEGGPVTYVFLGRVHARSFLMRFSPTSVDDSRQQIVSGNEQAPDVESSRAASYSFAEARHTSLQAAEQRTLVETQRRIGDLHCSQAMQASGASADVAASDVASRTLTAPPTEPSSQQSGLLLEDFSSSAPLFANLLGNQSRTQQLLCEVCII